MVDLRRAARLREARVAAGYRRASDAIEAFGWKSTYFSHENGTRGISRDRLTVYAAALRVRQEWLAYGIGPMKRGANRIRIEGVIMNLSTIDTWDETLE
jgi:phage repressor protein C with HTH and peptisase S24 domain